VSRNLRHVAEKSNRPIPPTSTASTAVYRATRSFAASSQEDGRFVIVKKGALLVIEIPLKQFGLVEAVCAEQTLLVFTRDIEMCAEFVDTRG
jgi:hypothetical protein